MGSDDRRLLILNTQEPNVNGYLTEAVADGFRRVLGSRCVHVSRYVDAVETFRRAACNIALCLTDYSASEK